MSFDKLRSTIETRPVGGTFYMKATEVAPLLERHDALLERVTVLERAIEGALADYYDNEIRSMVARLERALDA